MYFNVQQNLSYKPSETRKAPEATSEGLNFINFLWGVYPHTPQGAVLCIIIALTKKILYETIHVARAVNLTELL